jgi:hypothetical protein
MRVSDHGPVNDWYVFINGPWEVYTSRQGLSVAFTPNLSIPDINIDWTAIIATVQGFRLTDPAPLPATDSNTKLVWNLTSSSKVNPVTFTLVPNKFLRVALTAQTGSLGQDIPLQVEELAFPVAFIVIFSRRRRSQNAVADRDQDRDRAWLITRRLCFAVAILSALQLGIDIISMAAPYAGRIYLIEDLAQLCVIYGIAFAILRPHLRKVGRSLTILAQLLVWLCFIGNFLVDVFFYSSFPGGHLYLGDPSFHRLLLRIAELCPTFLCWVIILDGLIAVLPSMPAVVRRPRSLLAAGVLTLLSIFTLRSAFLPTDIFPTVFFPNIAGFIIVFGTLSILARDQRSVPVLLERGDRRVLALIVGYGMLLTGPQWYLGFHVGLVAIISITATLVVLTVSSRHSLIQPSKDDEHRPLQSAGDHDHSSVRPAGEILQGKKPEELRALQRRLSDAEDQLKKVTKDLNVLQSTPLVTDEQLRRREWLEKEEARLRSWPTNEGQS